MGNSTNTWTIIMKETIINIKTCWSEVSIKDYQQLQGLEEASAFDILSVLTDLPLSEIRELKMTTVNALMDEAEEILQSPIIKDKSEITQMEWVKAAGYEWRIEPSLEKYKAGQIIDLLELLKHENKIEHLDTIISVIVQPYKEERNWLGIRTMKEVQLPIDQKIRLVAEHFPAKEALILLAFFHTASLASAVDGQFSLDLKKSGLKTKVVKRPKK